ncbi:hypothetical protein IAR55_001191 [Kwoniella newhampshirensis]|uniref:Uncharacterized protein n=1 Tax=Kwoniella newhampshirensis TaxID=1651941 RepID=A0AAW0Z524_9TREE
MNQLPSLPDPSTLLDTPPYSEVRRGLDALRAWRDGRAVPDAYTPPGDLDPPPLPSPPYSSVERRVSTVSVGMAMPGEPVSGAFGACTTVQACVDVYNAEHGGASLRGMVLDVGVVRVVLGSDDPRGGVRSVKFEVSE